MPRVVITGFTFTVIHDYTINSTGHNEIYRNLRRDYQKQVQKESKMKNDTRQPNFLANKNLTYRDGRRNSDNRILKELVSKCKAKKTTLHSYVTKLSLVISLNIQINT